MKIIYNDITLVTRWIELKGLPKGTYGMYRPCHDDKCHWGSDGGGVCPRIMFDDRIRNTAWCAWTVSFSLEEWAEIAEAMPYEDNL